jgi:hypothetical protein
MLHTLLGLYAYKIQLIRKIKGNDPSVRTEHAN